MCTGPSQGGFPLFHNRLRSGLGRFQWPGVTGWPGLEPSGSSFSYAWYLHRSHLETGLSWDSQQGHLYLFPTQSLTRRTQQPQGSTWRYRPSEQGRHRISLYVLARRLHNIISVPSHGEEQ